VKLLFDANLSPVLARRLADAFPDSRHVCEFGLERASDRETTTFAAANGYCVATNDSDFRALRLQLGNQASRVVWIRLGNQTTRTIEAALRSRQLVVEAIAEDDAGVIEII